VNAFDTSTPTASQRGTNAPEAGSAKAFWDRTHSEAFDRSLSTEYRDAVNAASAHFGDVRGKRVLDLGCGNGATSLAFAEMGAQVIAVDASDPAIRSLSAFCSEHNIGNVEAHCLSATEIDHLPQVDFVFGCMILHHVEPFGPFVETLGRAITPGGRAFFYENSGVNPLLMWFRSHVVGRFGIPKYGDEEEMPLSRREVGMLREHFQVAVEYPRMVLLQLASLYLLRCRLMRLARHVDAALHRVPALRRLSYHQYLRLS
jgi:SAM-dependent methyltransferase